MKTRMAVVIGLAFLLLVGALVLLGGSPGSVSGMAQAMPLAQSTSVPTPTPELRYVSAGSGQDTGDCTDSSNPCKSIQYAVDQAVEGDYVYIASYDGTTRNVYTGDGDNVIELTKTLKLRGGHTYNPTLKQWINTSLLPAIVDGEGMRRVLYAKGVTPTLELLSFVNGKAERGGNVYAEDSFLKFVGTTVLSGTATYGGGMYLKNCQTSFELGSWAGVGSGLLSGLLLIQNNKADYGGGVYVEGGSPVFAALAVYSNTATVAGGGAYFEGGSPTFAGGVVLQNSADEGGGFYLYNSTARIAAVGVYSNTASKGAGFYLNGPLAFSAGGVPLILNNYVRYNHADDGGAFYFDQAVAGLLNNVVADNQATNGAAMYLRGASPQVYHNTLAQNAGGTGVYVTNTPGSVWPPVAPIPSTPRWVNDMVVSHTVGVYVASSGLPSPLENRVNMNGTLWWGNGKNVDGPGMVVTTTDVSGDPRFRCTGGLPDCVLPYHIFTDSVAVDAGIDVAPVGIVGVDVLVDIDGQLRPSGKGCDIGADEVVSRGHSVWLVPSLVLIRASPGETVTQTHWLVNSGTTTDTYDLSLSSSMGWSSLATSTPLTLVAGTSSTVQVRITVPSTATDDMHDTIRITATSQSASDAKAGALDEVFVVSGTLNLSVSKRAEASRVDPGEAVTYTIVVTKEGVVSGTLAVTLTDTTVPTSALRSWRLPANCNGDLASGAMTCTWSVPGATPSITHSWTVVITPTDVYTGLLINTVFVDASETDLSMSDNAAMVAVGVQTEERRVYLPLVLRDHAP